MLRDPEQIAAIRARVNEAPCVVCGGVWQAHKEPGGHDYTAPAWANELVASFSDAQWKGFKRKGGKEKKHGLLHQEGSQGD